MVGNEEEEEESMELGRKIKENPFLTTLIYYTNFFMKNVPPFTGQIVVIFCVLPVTIAIFTFVLTFIMNFGIAFVAQTISSIVIITFLIPCLAVCVICGFVTAYCIQFGRMVYFKMMNSSGESKHIDENENFDMLKMEQKLKLKMC